MVRGPVPHQMSSANMRAKTPSPVNSSLPARRCDNDHEHFNMEVVDEIFDIDIDDMFTMLFSDSPLFREFIKRRKTYDVRLGPWPDLPDENGEKTRTIYYTLSINYAIGPKCSPSVERQVLYPESQRGDRYLIDADCTNGGVPYSDHFSTVIRYCMTAAGPGQTRLYITGRVVYHKTVWGVVRGFIEKTAVSGLAESFGVMTNLLRAESERKAPRRAPGQHGGASTAAGAAAATRPSTLCLNQSTTSAERRVRLRGTSSRHSTASSATTAAALQANGSVSGSHADILRTAAEDASTADLDEVDSEDVDSGERWPNSYDTSAATADNGTDEYFYKGLSFWDNHNRDPAELLILLLFIVIIALVIVNAALYYEVTALELTVARTLLRERSVR